jgi:hypothetical protein
MLLMLDEDLASSGDEDGIAAEELAARGEVRALPNELVAGLPRGLDTGENESAE